MPKYVGSRDWFTMLDAQIISKMYDSKVRVVKFDSMDGVQSCG